VKLLLDPLENRCPTIFRFMFWVARIVLQIHVVGQVRFCTTRLKEKKKLTHD